MDAERWYVAVFVVASRVEGQADDALVDLQVRLIRASDDEQAYKRSLEMGARLGHSYRNSDGAEVVWEYRGLRDLRELDDQELVHGVEVFSQLTREPASDLVVEKRQLTCFWAEANKHRTAAEVRGE